MTLNDLQMIALMAYISELGTNNEEWGTPKIASDIQAILSNDKHPETPLNFYAIKKFKQYHEVYTDHGMTELIGHIKTEENTYEK